jgi:hypothetical protein
MSQNKIYIYQRRSVLRVGYESRLVEEAITEAIGTVTDSLTPLAVKMRTQSDSIALVENLNYTTAVVDAPTGAAWTPPQPDTA